MTTWWCCGGGDGDWTYTRRESRRVPAESTGRGREWAWLRVGVAESGRAQLLLLRAKSRVESGGGDLVDHALVDGQHLAGGIERQIETGRDDAD